MGGEAFVYRDGQRVTPYMKYQIDRLDADCMRLFGVRVIISSAIRTYEEQKDIFLSRYVTAGNVRGRRVYDTRWWNGTLWYRISSAGTVAQPGTSNHEVQGSKAAVDLRDSGRDGGLATAGSARSNWLRQNAANYGLVPSGFSFGEAWHYDVLNIWNTPPGGGSSAGDDMKVTHYYNDDGKARRPGGLPLAPGGNSWLNVSATAGPHLATNVVGGVGEYQFSVHLYVEGEPGDAVDLTLFWDQVSTDTPHSGNFVERVVIGPSGVAYSNAPFARVVPSGFAVYLSAVAPASNKKNVKITRLASDALLFA